MRRRSRWRTGSVDSPSVTRRVPETRRPTSWPISPSIGRKGGWWKDAVSIRDNVAAVEKRISAACARASRTRSEVTLVAVSKTFPASMIDAAIAAGLTEIGENRVQEARDKKLSVSGAARWHL